MENNLNDKQKRFCEEYVIDFNASQAAKRAGYSKKTAGSIGHELLKKPEIEQYLSFLINSTGEKLGITREMVLKEIGRLAFSDLRKYFNEDGGLKKITDLDDEASAALSAVDVYEERVTVKDDAVVGVTKKIKTYDKTKALEMLAKHFNIYSDAPQTTNVVKVGYGKEE